MAVTGLGVFSALGQEVASYWNALRQGQSGIRPFEDPKLERVRFKNGAWIRYQPADFFEKREVESLDLFAQYLAIASREAVSDAQLVIEPERAHRVGIFAGSAGGGQVTLDREYHRVYAANRNRVHPVTIARFMINAAVSRVSQEHGITGPTVAVSTACSSANHALGQAFQMVRLGQLDAALAGGSEAPFCYGFLKAWEALRAIDPESCRPFCKNRQGMSLGEGAGVLVLEPLKAAQARGAPIYAEVLGCGMSSDAFELIKPKPEGAAQAMRAALEDADLAPTSIDYINAHGTGTVANDVSETVAIRQVFGSHADSLLVSSTKSMHGHALGAAGALEAVATVLALKDGVVPPTIGLQESDPECDLNYVPHTARSGSYQKALSNSFAFGGLNAVVAFGRVD